MLGIAKRNVGLVWTMLLVFYFIMFGFVISSSNGIGTLADSTYFGDDIDESDAIDVYEDYGILSLDGACSYPRVYNKTDGNQVVEQSRKQLAGVSCFYTSARYNETQCLAISGCEWRESLIYTDHCEGQIAETSRQISTDNIDNADVFFATDLDNAFAVAPPRSEEVYSFENVILDQDLYYPAYRLSDIRSDQEMCEFFAFTWLDTNEIFEQEVQGQSIYTIMTQFLTFSYDWDTGSSAFDDILTFLTVWLPLIMFIGALYILVVPTK